jgi:hypothetical protein
MEHTKQEIFLFHTATIYSARQLKKINFMVLGEKGGAHTFFFKKPKKNIWNPFVFPHVCLDYKIIVLKFIRY